MSGDRLLRSLSRFAGELPAVERDRVAVALEACPGPHSPRVGSVVASLGGGNHGRADLLVRAWRDHAPDVTGGGLALALRAAGAASDRERTRRARVVWTGPDSGAAARGSAGVLLELVGGANDRLLLLSFASFRIAKLDAALRDAVARGVRLTLVLETVVDSGEALSHDLVAHYEDLGARVLRWPIEKRPPGAKFHAKAVVADGRRALVTSANLTGSALLTNVELGVLVEDSDVAQEIEEHVRRMEARGDLAQVG